LPARNVILESVTTNKCRLNNINQQVAKEQFQSILMLIYCGSLTRLVERGAQEIVSRL
jgi:hypothetical protein